MSGRSIIISTILLCNIGRRSGKPGRTREGKRGRREWSAIREVGRYNITAELCEGLAGFVFYRSYVPSCPLLFRNCEEEPQFSPIARQNAFENFPPKKIKSGLGASNKKSEGADRGNSYVVC